MYVGIAECLFYMANNNNETMISMFVYVAAFEVACSIHAHLKSSKMKFALNSMSTSVPAEYTKWMHSVQFTKAHLIIISTREFRNGICKTGISNSDPPRGWTRNCYVPDLECSFTASNINICFLPWFDFVLSLFIVEPKKTRFFCY